MTARRSTPQRPTIIVKSGDEAALAEWRAAFAEVRPDLTVRGWADPDVSPDEVDYALVWEPETGRLAGFPNLRLIFSAAAGLEHLACDERLPAIPVVRMAAPAVGQAIGEYVCLACLAMLRDWRRVGAAQQAARWDTFTPDRDATETRVGVMGFGRLGARSAAMLSGLGFRVTGWARNPKPDAAFPVLAGDAELDRFLANSDMLVCVLPDTGQTRGLLDRRRLATLPRGAGIVNAGRGSLIVFSDLVEALDSGHVRAAILDVFDEEPLPASHPAWHHSGITVTSHVAGPVSRRRRAHFVADCIARFERGEAPANLFNAARGY